MKKDQHITININDEEYNALLLIAQNEDRTITAVCRRMIQKQLLKDIAQYTDMSKEG